MDVLRESFMQHKNETALALLKSLPADELVGVNNTFLHVAADVVDTGYVTRLAVGLGYGYLITSRAYAYRNETPLHVAIRRGNLHSIKELLPYISTQYLSQPIIDECVLLAATFGMHNILELLLRKVTPNKIVVEDAIDQILKNRYAKAGTTMLQFFPESVASRFPIIVATALREKKNRAGMVAFAMDVLNSKPSIVDNRGGSKNRTALHIAASYRGQEALDFVHFLVDNFARLDLMDTDDLTPPQVAYAANNTDTLGYLLTVPNCPVFWQQRGKGASLYNRIASGTDTELLDKMLIGNKQLRNSAELIKYVMVAKNVVFLIHLLRTYPTIAGARGYNGRNALMTAIYDRMPVSYIELILKHGEFDIDAQDDRKCTALHYAARDGSRYVIQLVLARECRSSFTRNVDGDLPIDCGPVFDVQTLTIMLRPSKRLYMLCKPHIAAHIERHASPELKEYLERPQTMVQCLVDANRMYGIMTPIRH